MCNGNREEIGVELMYVSNNRINVMIFQNWYHKNYKIAVTTYKVNLLTSLQ